MGVWHLEFWGSGLRDLGNRGLEFRAWSSGFWNSGLGFRA